MMIGPTTVVLLLYIGSVLFIGWASSRRSRSSNDYLQATAALPLAVVVPAYLAANCGALEVVGLSALAAQYGAQAFHFIWIGAIPAMVLLAVSLMRVYRRAGITTVPQYLQVRYGSRLRLVNAVVTALIVLLLAGVSVYALGQVVSVITTLSFRWALLLCDLIVVTYVLLGGIRATMYNQMLQLFLLLVALTPLTWKSLRTTGGFSTQNLGLHAHAWVSLPWFNPHAPMDVFGVVVGLGCILSFSYWCTDFVLMQRAFSARTLQDAQRVPVFAGFGKLLFGFLIVLPGLAATTTLPSLHGRYDSALPSMMRHTYGPWMLAVGLTSLCASLMSALAANISAFATVLLTDIAPFLRTPALAGQQRRAITKGLTWDRAAILFAAVAALLLSSLNFFFGDLMELVQLIFSVLGVPFWAVFLCGMVSGRATESRALLGLLAGSMASLALLLASYTGTIRFGSVMACNFYAAALGFLCTTGITLVPTHHGTSPRVSSATTTLDWKTQDRTVWWASGLLVVAALALNILWR